MNGLLWVIILSAPQSIFSPNQKYQGVVEYDQVIDLTVMSFIMLGEHGETLYVKTSPPAMTFYVNDNGTVFATNESQLFFYDKAGHDTLLKGLEYPNGFGFSPDHKLFFASDRNELAAYCTCGRLRHQFKPCRLFASADQGSVVATVVNDTLALYRNGREQYKITLATPYVHEIRFTPDGKQIVLKEPNGTETFDSLTGTKVEAP